MAVYHKYAAELGVALLTVFEAATHIGQVYPDSAGYIAAAYYFEGAATRATIGPAYFRLLRPVVPLLASLLNHFMGIDTAFSVLNFVLWCASSILMFKLTELLTDRWDAAVISAALFNASIPMLFFGGAILSDMGGYFFGLLGTYIVLKLDIPRASYLKVLGSALVVTAGVLTREFVASVVITLIIWALLTKGSWRRVALLVLVVIAGALAWSTAIGISYSSWLSFNIQFISKNVAFESQNAPLWLRVWTWVRTVRLAFRLEIIFAGIAGFIGIVSGNYRSLGEKINFSGMAASLLGPAILTLALALAGAGTDYRYSFTLFPGLLPFASIGVLWASGLIAHFLAGRGNRSTKLAGGLSLIFVAVFVLETNLIALKFVSLPWHPYVSP